MGRRDRMLRLFVPSPDKPEPAIREHASPPLSRAALRKSRRFLPDIGIEPLRQMRVLPHQTGLPITRSVDSLARRLLVTRGLR